MVVRGALSGVDLYRRILLLFYPSSFIKLLLFVMGRLQCTLNSNLMQRQRRLQPDPRHVFFYHFVSHRFQVDVERPDKKGREQLFAKYIAPLKVRTVEDPI